MTREGVPQVASRQQEVANKGVEVSGRDSQLTCCISCVEDGRCGLRQGLKRLGEAKEVASSLRERPRKEGR